MKNQNLAYDLLQELSFTNEEIAVYTGLSESMIKKVRAGIATGSVDTENKILNFVKHKLEQVEKKLKTRHSSTLFDDV